MIKIPVPKKIRADQVQAGSTIWINHEPKNVLKVDKRNEFIIIGFETRFAHVMRHVIAPQDQLFDIFPED